MCQTGPESSKIFLGFGSNLGNPKRNIHQALEHLGESAIKVKSLSSFYLTEPVGYEAQPWFINAVAEVETNLAPRPLLERCLLVERLMKRKRLQQSGPRIIDIDILFYGELIIEEGDLAIPHPRMLERKFVLLPLAEIAPTFMHPGARRSVQDLKQDLHSEKKAVKLLS